MTELATPLVTVTLADGTTETVRVLNPDYLRWDRTASKHGWPAMDKAPHTWLTFVAWSALRREGRIGDDVTWEAFSERLCLQVENATGSTTASNGTAPAAVEPVAVPSIAGLDTLGPETADPTPPGPEPG